MKKMHSSVYNKVKYLAEKTAEISEGYYNKDI